jgi:hypothetical protein
MILSSRKKPAWSYRTLHEAPLPIEANVDITLFANYYGTVKDTRSFNDPTLYTDKKFWARIKYEIDQLFDFRRKYKHAKNR